MKFFCFVYHLLFSSTIYIDIAVVLLPKKTRFSLLSKKTITGFLEYLTNLWLMFRLKPKYFWRFQGVQNGNIDHEWVNLYKIERGLTQGIELVLSIYHRIFTRTKNITRAWFFITYTSYASY